MVTNINCWLRLYSAPGRNRTFVRRLTAARSAIEPPEHTEQRGGTRCCLSVRSSMGCYSHFNLGLRCKGKGLFPSTEHHESHPGIRCQHLYTRRLTPYREAIRRSARHGEKVVPFPPGLLRLHFTVQVRELLVAPLDDWIIR